MLNKTAQEDRALFLRAFTKEILFNLQKKIEREHRELELKEKLRKEEEKRQLKEPLETKREIKKEEFVPSIKYFSATYPEYSVHAKHPTHPIHPVKKMFKPILKPQIQQMPLVSRRTIQIAPKPIVQLMQPPVYAPAVEMDLGSLNPMIADKQVTMIECPGPDKFLIVKKAGQINSARISLSGGEIDKIIEQFSEKAKIPVIRGIFKAVVGNLAISAVISEFVGGRFIINKFTPYSLIEQQSQQINQAQFQHSKRMQKQMQRQFLKR